MSEWISVDDKLPSGQVMVLLYAPRSYHTAHGITYGWWDYEGRGFMHHSNSGYSVVEDDMSATRTDKKWTGVTHWMPLPEPPEAKQ